MAGANASCLAVFLLFASCGLAVEVPPEWTEETGKNPVRVVCIAMTKDATPERLSQIQRDLKDLAAMRGPSSEFSKAAVALNLITKDEANKEGEIDWLIATVWEEKRFGHPNQKIPPISFDKALFADGEKAEDSLKNLVAVKIESVPAGASIIVDGVSRGKTTAVLYLNKNVKFKIELKLEGFLDHKIEEYAPKSGGKIEHTFKKQ